MTTLKGALAVLAAATTLVTSTTSFATDEREQCASAADQAQQARDDGKYRRAREQFLSCARDACPGPIKKDCLDWLAKLDDVAPTVVFSAKDGDRDVADVKVLMDGVQITEKLEGKPLLVDGGEHAFEFERAGHVQEQKVLISAGQKGRNISVQFGGAATAVKPPVGDARSKEGSKGGGSVVPAFVVGGVGVVALGSFAYFGLSGQSAVGDLESCKGRCAESDVDKARTKLIIADISLGIGLVALGVATYLFVTRPRVEDHVDVGRSAPARSRLLDVRLDVAPVAGGGAAASVGARF